MPPARIVHEDPSHGLRCNAEEVCPVAPLDPALVDQLEIGLVDKRGLLQRVFDALSTHGALGLPVELRIDRRQQPLAHGLIAAAPCQQQLGHVGGVRPWWNGRLLRRRRHVACLRDARATLVRRPVRR